jgi:hypothetical protein
MKCLARVLWLAVLVGVAALGAAQGRIVTWGYDDYGVAC